MNSPFSPMHSPRPQSVEVYIPRAAFERVTEQAAQAAALRLSYPGPLHWETSSNELPPGVDPGSVRVRCTVAEATVFLECFRVLVDEAQTDRLLRLEHEASAAQHDELLIDYAEAMGVLMSAIDDAVRGRS